MDKIYQYKNKKWHDCDYDTAQYVLGTFKFSFCFNNKEYIYKIINNDKKHGVNRELTINTKIDFKTNENEIKQIYVSKSKYYWKDSILK